MDKETRVALTIFTLFVLGILIIEIGGFYHQRWKMDYFFEKVKECPNVTKIIYNKD